jgi:restriction system protein
MSLQVLVAMGDTGRQGRSEQVGRTNDGGIEGVIYLDRLGLERTDVQAKRWQAPVGAPTGREFAGTMEGDDATEGVFLSTWASGTIGQPRFVPTSFRV